MQQVAPTDDFEQQDTRTFVTATLRHRRLRAWMPLGAMVGGALAVANAPPGELLRVEFRPRGVPVFRELMAH